MIFLYRLIAIAAVATYAGAGLFGWELQSEGRRQIPTSVRQSPGGYRSFHFWHTGFHGGK